MAKQILVSDARAVAAQVIADVSAKQRSLTATLVNHLPAVNDKDRSFCQQLSYGVLRQYPALRFLAQQLLKKAFKTKDADIDALLLMGLYQLRELRTPAHAAISETVNAAKILNKSWATGLLNACLRNYQRQQTKLDALLAGNVMANFAHPDWLIQLYQQDWPRQWQQICLANNQQPPMMLRVNHNQLSRDDYLQVLAEADIDASPLPTTDTGVLLSQPRDVYTLPGFTQGWVSVQDGAAQQVAALLSVQAGQRILDACAAPGGKTCHILELQPDNDVYAVDISAQRLEQIEQNTARLSLNAQLIVADAVSTKDWWDGELFDRILIDAPCSGSGVIRRHPDIKLLRREEDIASLSQIQQQLLDKLWPLLKADGVMVYTTCSALKQENELQIESFLQRHPEAEEIRLTSPPASERPYGYQRLPGDNHMDGFYYACLRQR